MSALPQNWPWYRDKTICMIDADTVCFDRIWERYQHVIGLWQSANKVMFRALAPCDLAMIRADLESLE